MNISSDIPKCLLLLVKTIIIFCAMAHGKCSPEENHEPSHKCTAIGSEMRIRMTRKYVGGPIYLQLRVDLVLRYQLLTPS